MEEHAPAKVNLALHVRGRRPDGHHEIETLFAFTDFGDHLVASPADDWGLTVTGPFAGPPFAGLLSDASDNLVLRAARLFAEHTGLPHRYRFALTKRIPVAAGLGGGSADAAATLRLLNRETGAGLPNEALERLAAKLGADVPACVRSTTCFATGTGDRFTTGPDLSGTRILLVNPRVPLSTGAVFRLWDGHDRGPLQDWESGRNDLTTAAIALAPEVGTTLSWLGRSPGIRLARMSGSGATCFAILDGDAPPPPPGWWHVETRLR